jgi:hypothetical protein
MWSQGNSPHDRFALANVSVPGGPEGELDLPTPLTALPPGRQRAAYFKLAPERVDDQRAAPACSMYSAICLRRSSPIDANGGIWGASARFFPGARAHVTIPSGFPA